MVGEPVAAEDVLADDHQESHKYGVGDAQFVVAGKSVATEDETADDGHIKNLSIKCTDMTKNHSIGQYGF